MTWPVMKRDQIEMVADRLMIACILQLAFSLGLIAGLSQSVNLYIVALAMWLIGCGAYQYFFRPWLRRLPCVVHRGLRGLAVCVSTASTTAMWRLIRSSRAS